jgi:hypothetical protein
LKCILIDRTKFFKGIEIKKNIQNNKMTKEEKKYRS